MPFSNPISAASARNRKVKDKAIRNNSITSSGRRHRDIPRGTNNRSPAASLRAHSSLHIHHNATLDQLPPLPSSRSASPSSTASPILQTSQLSSNSKGVYHLAIPPHTPASLQPYLEAEPDSGASEDPLPADPAKHPKDLDNEPINSWPSPALQSFLEASPWPKSNPFTESSETASIPPATSLSSTDLTLPVCSQTSPRLYSPTPVTHRSSCLTNPRSYNAVIPWQVGYSSEQYLASSYSGSQHCMMTQPNGQPGDAQLHPARSIPYYPDYGSPHPLSMPFNTGRSPQIQGYGAASRSNGLDYAIPGVGPGQRDPGGQAHVERAAISRHAPEDDGVDLLHRVRNVIPDLHLLLDRYRDTSSQLNDQQTLTRQKEEQMIEHLRQKDFQIHQLGKEIEWSSQKHSAENSKLRLEIGNLEEKQRESKDVVTALKSSRDQFEEACQSLQREKESLEIQTKELIETVEHNQSQWKEKVSGEFSVKEKKILEELQRKTKAEVDLHKKILGMQKVHSQELDNWRGNLVRERTDLERNHNRSQKDLETTLVEKQRELDECRKRELECREDYRSDRTDSINALNEQRTKLDILWEDQRKELLSQHSEEMDKMKKDWSTSQELSNKHLEEENAELRKEIENLRAGWDSDKTKFTKATSELKVVVTSLDHENVGLKKMIETFGEATDFRSRGDTFFIDAFTQLRRQIEHLAVEHCKGAVGHVPDDLLKNISPDIPDFLSDTNVSVQLRAAYVQCTISRILTKRIFEPFLFTLHRRHEGADHLFQAMSQKFRLESFRREAFWRQQTLHAAYTVSSAKQSINIIAAVIVDEIIDEVQHFMCPDEKESMKAAIRRIVKLSAESWRYARLERGMITATVPSNQSLSEQLTIGHAGRFLHEGCAHDDSPNVVLSPLPFIRREPTHGDLNLDSNTIDQGCIYLQGDAIYADSPIITARLAELKPCADGSVPPKESMDGGREAVSRPEVLAMSPELQEQERLGQMDAPAILNNSAKPTEESELSKGKAVPAVKEGGTQDSDSNGAALDKKADRPLDETLGWRTTSLKAASESEVEISKWAESFDAIRSANKRR